MAITGEGFLKPKTVFGEREIPCYQTDNYGAVPQVVYKYLDLTSLHNKNSVAEDYLWFSDPISFNDPFDCQVTPDFRLLAGDESLCRKYYEFVSRSKEPNLSGAGRKLAVDQNVHRIISNKSNIDFFKELEKEALSLHLEGIKEWGILCTSMINDNILLWSHYANKHTGICLGLNVNKLLTTYRGNGEMGAGDVKYGDYSSVPPPFADDDNEINKTFQPFFLAKAPFWNYELEYRFLEYPCIQRKKSIGDILESVYMGCSISDNDESFIKDFCSSQNRQIKLYKAEKAFFKYRIEFNEVNY
jgi:hypothetical protein